MTSELLLIPIGACALSFLLTRYFCDPDSWFYVLDHPNERSLHARPVPRSGGIAIFIAIAFAWVAAFLFYPFHGMAGIALGVSIVAGISFFDDRYSLAPVYRLIAHVIAAAIVILDSFSLQHLEVPWAIWHWSYVTGVVVCVLFTVWMINLYNFMDGMDGFAGGMGVLGFGFLAVMGWVAGHDAFFVVNLSIAAVSAGFLVFNFPPARIFMGDVGSSTLGLLAAAFSLWGARDGVFPFWIAVLVFSPFIADATVTLLRRLWRREKIWQAHKTHYYQQLVQSGWGHRKTVLMEYLIMLGCALTALFSLHATAVIQAAMLVGWAFFYIIFFSWVSWHIPRRRHNSA
jgi:UDP-N-acetylmuramyl pentapeptide phosphotransferase/UDP-N-acetylglucosamine-1-phosphate transferase